MDIDYKGFIEQYFFLKTKKGEIIPFKFNAVQNMWYDQLLESYGKPLQGIRENDLKGRQFGISTVIAGIFTTDFIMSARGWIPLTDSEIYSYRDKDTEAHFQRVNMFLDSYLVTEVGGDYRDAKQRLEGLKLRNTILKTDTTNLLVAKNSTQIQTATAGAKVAGRGSTKQNIHWSEVAFYSNTTILDAETLVTGAEEQVPQNYGKIFRETTGNMAGDFFSREYTSGKDGKSEFKSRFLAWYLHKEYTTPAEPGWVAPEYYSRLIEEGMATPDQCYWHYQKTRQLTNKKRMREYPTYDYEAFMMAGTTFFDDFARIWHTNRIKTPIKTATYAEALG